MLQRRAFVTRGGSLSLLAALAGCAAPPPPRPRADAAAPAAHAARTDITLYALSLLDRQYTYGGRGPATGFDCSGLVAHVYREAAQIRLTGSSADMARALRSIDRHALQAGDLVFFNTLGPAFSHVGIYVGEDQFVHASNPRTGVRKDRLSARYYATRFEVAKTLFS